MFSCHSSKEIRCTSCLDLGRQTKICVQACQHWCDVACWGKISLSFVHYLRSGLFEFLISPSGQEDAAYVVGNVNASDSDEDMDGKDALMDSSYQCLKWQTHCPENFYQLTGMNYEDV